MVKLDEMDDLDKQLEEVLNKIDSDTKKEIEKGDIKEKAEEVKEINKEQIVEDANSASEAVVEGFGNINQMIYERLDINRACLMILLVLILILIFKEDIMKLAFVKNLLK